MNKWTRPFEQAHASVRGGESGFARQHLYFAFLSYSHADSGHADWLHQELERFRVPSSLAGRLTARGAIPARLTPIFRDRHELAAADDLGEEIHEALKASRCLIVLCSPAAVKSKWTNAEIHAFKRAHPDGCIIAAIVAGEPFASDLPGREQDECLPPALRQKYDRRGRPTAKRAEPLAADLRESGDGKRLGLLKIVAGLLGVGLDDLVQRDHLRRQRRLALVAAASLAGMVFTTTLAVTASNARDAASEQRQQAEGLVGFMLGDLKDKLEPLGRLDVLDSVGSRALAYYQHQDKGSLSDEALAQRSRALSLLGQIASSRGDITGALGRYTEAMAGTGEIVRRHGDDPNLLFEHAQNVFYVGALAAQQGRMEQAESAFRSYKQLADRMVSLEPDNRKWRMEVQYAAFNLGILLYDERRFPAAVGQFSAALKNIEMLSAGNPGNVEYRRSVSESLGWLGDALFAQGRIDESVAKRERQVRLVDELIRTNPAGVEDRQTAIRARRALGRMLLSRGETEAGIRQLRSAVAVGQALMPIEPANMDWVEFTAAAQLDLAGALLATRSTEEAAVQARSACDLVDRLRERQSSTVGWRMLDELCLERRAAIALARGSPDEALALAQRAFASVRGQQPSDRIQQAFELARLQALIGDCRAASLDRDAARRMWQQAVQSWPKAAAEKPPEMALRAELLRKAGSSDEAGALERHLRAMGYRQSTALM